MSSLFSSKVVIVTGAGSGIGRAAALAFAREGAKVVIVDIDAAGGEKTVSSIKDVGGESFFVKADVSRSMDVKAMVAICVEKYGGLDCAFNNAGIGGTPFVPVADYDEAVWDQVMGVDLKGVFLCMKYEIPEMLKRGKGAIVNTSSTQGLKSGAVVGTAYSASKHGVIGLTKTTAIEYASKGMRVNAVCPGFTETDTAVNVVFHDKKIKDRVIASLPMGRPAKPEEIAAAVLWLCSDAASYVNGHALVVDGGLIA